MKLHVFFILNKEQTVIFDYLLLVFDRFKRNFLFQDEVLVVLIQVDIGPNFLKDFLLSVGRNGATFAWLKLNFWITLQGLEL